MAFSIILRETRETAGKPPVYRLIDESNLQLSIPAADLEVSPAQTVITVHFLGHPLPGADLLVLFPNKTWKRATTDANGEANIDLYMSHLPMDGILPQLLGYTAHLEREWTPSHGALAVELEALPGRRSRHFLRGNRPPSGAQREVESHSRHPRPHLSIRL